MAGKGAADIVFVVDCSLSMVLWNIMCCSKAMIYRQIMFSWYDANATWDLRVDFVAHGIRPGFWARSVYEESTEALVTGLYGEGQGRFFTSDIAVFQSALSELGPSGDEASFVALDFALDLPWRSHSGSHRVVVLLTDEPMETGTYLKQSLALSDSLIEKIHALKVMLFTPSLKKTKKSRRFPHKYTHHRDFPGNHWVMLKIRMFQNLSQIQYQYLDPHEK